MMYPYMTLADETEIVHSQIIEKDGIKKVIVNFERPTDVIIASADNVALVWIVLDSERTGDMAH